MRRALLAALLAAGLGGGAAAPPTLGAQDLSQRFSIAEVRDTVFTFAVGNTRWVKPRQLGVAVDARARDLLVARFRVLSVRNGLATALITGETTRLAPVHTVVMRRPPERWYRNRYFWAGAIVGLLGGAAGGAAL